VPSRVSSALTACALALCAGAAWAQTSDGSVPPGAAKPANSTSVAPVTVEAAAPPKVIEKQTWNFVEAYAAASPKLDLIARWREPICVQVVNLPPEQAAMVKARVVQVAKGLGLPSRPAGCASNIQIVLTSQPQAFLDNVAKNDEQALGFHWRSDLKKLKTVTHPIQGWYKTATQSGKIADDGLAFAVLKDAAGNDIPNPGDAFPKARAGESVDLPENPSPQGCAGSLITDCERSIFKNELVVVDSHAVQGKDLGAVADYLAMMALSQIKPAETCSPLPSIFDLLVKTPCAGRDPPGELTAADAAYLTALYASDPEVKAASVRVEIANRMSEMLIKSNVAVPAGERAKAR